MQETAERLPRVRVAVLVVEDDRVLLVKHQKYGATYWLLPGGGLEWGETIEECARRETLEETGIDVEIGDILYVSESIPSDGHRHVVNVFLHGKAKGGVLIVGDDDVLVGTEYRPLAELEKLDLRPPIAKELLAWLKSPGASRRLNLGNRWRVQ